MNFGELKIGESFYLRNRKKKYTKISDDHATTDTGTFRKRHFYDDDIVLLPSEIEEKEKFNGVRIIDCFCQIDNVNKDNVGIIVINKRCHHHKHLYVDGNNGSKNGDFRE
jgi:hypothetical protein